MKRFALVPLLLAVWLGFALYAGPVAAQVQSETYATLSRQLDGRLGFEALPQRAEPGFNLNTPIRFYGVWVGERLAGQSVGGAPHDAITGPPTLPLAAIAGQPGQNLSIALHRGFASNALFPVGPDGFPATSARGEGAATILFDRDQAAFGLRVHADYANPLGSAAAPGSVRIQIYARSGQLIATTEHRLQEGITEIGLRRDGNIPDIAAIIITNSDPGGIAIDDILFQLTALIG